MGMQTIRDIDECQQPMPSIAGKAAQLREQYPHLNRAARKRTAREQARREQLDKRRELCRTQETPEC